MPDDGKNLTIETLEIVIERNATEAANRIDALVSNLQKLKSVVRGSMPSTLGKISTGIADIGKATDTINVEKLQALASVLEHIRELKGISKKTTSGLAEMASATSGAETKSASESKPTEGAVSAMGKKNWGETFAKNINSFYDKAKKSNNMFNKLFKSMQRIALYRLIRTFFSSLTKAIKEGTQNIYQYDKALGGVLSQNLDNLATSTNYLKNSLGAAISNVLIPLTPIITQIVDGMAQFTNGIAVLTAKAQGLSTVTIAAKGMKVFAENAKAAKSAIMGFDELNTAGSGTDIMSMFKTVDISGTSDVVEQFKQKVGTISAIISAALIPIGVLTMLLGHPVLGIGLMAAGAAGSIAVSATLDNAIPDKVKTILGAIMSAVSSAMLAIGVILCVNGVIPLGIGFIVAGAAGMASSVAINHDYLLNRIKTLGASLLSIISGFGLIIGFIFLLSPPTIPLGLGMLWAAFKGTQAAKAIDDNALTSWIASIGEKAVKMVRNIGINMANALVDGLNRIGAFDLPDSLKKVRDFFGWDIPDHIQFFNIPRIPAYANGGMPEDGFFFANSSEIVGKFANGRNVVENNEQIIESITRGVYNAVLSANENTRGGEMTVRVYLDGKEIKTNYDRTTYNSGTKIATGGIVV